MSETGSVRLLLMRANGTPWTGELRVRIRDQTDRLIYDKRKNYTEAVRFENLARVPHGRHRLSLRTACCSPVSLCTTVDREVKHHPIRMRIRGSVADRVGDRIDFPSYGDSRFALWDQLKVDLDPEIKLSSKVPVRSDPWDVYYKDFHSNLARDYNHRRLACLFNLYTKMTQNTPLGIGESLGVKYPWDFVGTVFHIQQDRFYAQVKSSLAPRMDKILSTMRERPNAIFAAHGAGTHNIPAPEGFEKYPVTFKSDLADKVANLQLSFASKTSNCGTVWVLDADIDERTGFAHAAEAIRNIVTGGKTNPYTVHELLASEGYRVPYEIPA